MSRADISVVVIGRNDDYEPGWGDRLSQIIGYNTSACAAAGINLDVAFVEWNPPPGRPLLAEALCDAHPNVGVTVVPEDVHDALGSPDDLPIVLALAVNVGIRAATGRHVLVTGGDVLLGRALIARIASEGLRNRVLYRAERVNIAADLSWDDLRSDGVEDIARVVSIDSCREPPYDEPPFTNACGDFLLLDRGTAVGLRGFDESVRRSRLHLDSRFALNAMFACRESILLGEIFHLSHSRSFVNAEHHVYAGGRINPLREVPYLNRPMWGLGDRLRLPSCCGRICRVDGAAPAGLNGHADLSWPERRRARRSGRALEKARASRQPSSPPLAALRRENSIGATALESLGHWDGADTAASGQRVRVTTPAAPWAYAATALLPDAVAADEWLWAWVDVAAVSGCISVGILVDGVIVDEEICGTDSGPQRIWLRVDQAGSSLLVRNADSPHQSTVEVVGVGTAAAGRSFSAAQEDR